MAAVLCKIEPGEEGHCLIIRPFCLQCFSHARGKADFLRYSSRYPINHEHFEQHLSDR